MKTKFLLNCLIILFYFLLSLKSQTYPIVVIPEGTSKCGCVDMNGKFIIKPVYKYCHNYTEEGTALVIKDKKQKKCFLFDTLGNQIIPVVKFRIYTDPWTTLPRIFKNNILCLKQGGKWGAMNSKGKICVPFVYKELTDFNDDYALGNAYDKFYVISKNGSSSQIKDFKITNIKHFSEGLAPVEVKGEKIGFVDTLGNMVIEPQFSAAGYFNEGFAWVKTKEGLIGVINKKGEWITKPEFSTAGNFSGGYAWVRTKDNLIGYINTNGEIIIKPQFSFAYDFDKESGMAMVKKDEKWLYVDTSGNFYNFDVTDKLYNFSEGLAVGRIGKKVGYLNNKGEWAINPEFEVAHEFINGFAKVQKDEKCGIIDKKGNWILPPKYKKTGELTVHFQKYD